MGVPPKGEIGKDELELAVKYIRLESVKAEGKVNLCIAPSTLGWDILGEILNSFAAEGKTRHYRGPPKAGCKSNRVNSQATSQLP